MPDKIIPLEDLREQRDYEQLLTDLREFVEAKVSAGEPIVVIIERNVSFWGRVKEGFCEAVKNICVWSNNGRRHSL